MRLSMTPVVTMLLLAAGAARAEMPVPAELPPAGFAERQYIDSKGCVFQQASMNGTLIWVPQFDGKNRQLCHRPRLAATAARLRKPAPAKLVETEAAALADTLCDGRSAPATRLWISDGRRVIHCGSAVENGVALVNGLGVPGLTVDGVDDRPSERARVRAMGRDGYRVVWSSGPLRDGTGTAAVGQGTGALWVQTGAFSDHANADRAVAAIAAAGYPAARQEVRGGRLTATLAGPFPTEVAAQAALVRLGAAGYSGAFIR